MKIFFGDVDKIAKTKSEVRVCIYVESFLVRQVTRSKTRLGCTKIAN